MAKTFYVSPGRSYTVTASEGTTITYPGIATPAATVGSAGSVTFNCTATEIVVSDDSAKIVQNFNDAGAAAVGAGGSGSLEGVALLEGGNAFSGDQSIAGDVTIEGSVVITGDVESSADNLKEAQLYVPGILSGNLVSGHVYDLGVLAQDQDLSGLAFEALEGYVQTCEIWMETGVTGYSVTWPEGSVWPNADGGIAPSFVLPANTRYRFAVRNEGNGTMVIDKAYDYSV